jgi:hypothetical protein
MEQAGRALAGLAKGQLNPHLILRPIVTLGADGKTAKGTWYEMAMLGEFGSPGFVFHPRRWMHIM